VDKLWSGRFKEQTAAFAGEWGASIGFDKALFRQDITGSIAHCRMLAKQGIITADEASVIEDGLNSIVKDIESGSITFDSKYEDIHMAVESLLTERIGDTGKKLHTARSRNDQVATDLKIWLKGEILDDLTLLRELLDALVARAKAETDTIMPGYTHLQHAQPVSLAFHMLAYYQMFKRDRERLMDAFLRTDTLPLGSGALSGTSFDTDRDFLAHELGFNDIAPNAMDAVSDRDYAIEYLSAAAIIMMHLSRFCEELIIWNSSEFGFIEMSDAYSTGSSIMPQKKNPDMAELIRGKTGRVYGDLISLLTTMKGLPLAYNKDMQEDKEPVFDAAKTIGECLRVFIDMFSSINFNREKMALAAHIGFMDATDAADYLVAKGIPFREAHEIVGRLVLFCENCGIGLDEAPLEKLQEFCPKFDNEFYDIIDLSACANAKTSPGGTSRDRVLEQIRYAEEELEDENKILHDALK